MQSRAVSNGNDGALGVTGGSSVEDAGGKQGH